MAGEQRAPGAGDRGDVHNVIRGGVQRGPVIMGRDIYLPRPEQTGRPVLLSPRPAELAGREDMLDELRERLEQGGGSSPRVVTLHGMAGAGKTCLALEYAYRHKAGFFIVWQFAAEDRSGIEAGFARLGALLGASGPFDPRDPVASVHALLADSARPWLLIFDNVPNPAVVQGFLPAHGPGQILMTSQYALWGPGQGIEVPVLRTDAASRFLVRRTGDQDETSARDLADEMGGLPLALEQAGAYVSATGITLAIYLGLYRVVRTELLDRGDVPEHPASVTATIRLALARLKAEDPISARLLWLLAWLAPEPVPLGLMLRDASKAAELGRGVTAALRPFQKDPLAIGDAIIALRRYSLINPAEDGMVQVHRLVQAVVRDYMSGRERRRWRVATATLISSAIPEDPRSPEAWPLFRALMPHARARLNLTRDDMLVMAIYLGSSGQHSAARELARQIVEALTCSVEFGPEDASTLTAWHELAHWTGLAGDRAGARDLYAELLKVRARVQGPEHPDTLAARHSLARWTGQAGDAASARDLYGALLPIRERVLGVEHPDTLATRHNLASWTGEAGDAAGARDLSGRLLPVRERVLGAEHPDTLSNYHELASWTGEAGDASGARDLYRLLLPVSTRVLGAEHPSTLTMRHEFARWTGEAGDAVGARELYAELLPIRERVQGAEHPSTLATRLELAHWTGEAGDAVRARELYAELLSIRERVQGVEHPSTLTTRHEFARWTGEAGDTVEARDLSAKLLLVSERVNGLEHPSTLAVRRLLTQWTATAGEAESCADSG